VDKTINTPILTLALPVFNDAEALLETIRSIAPELHGYSNLVEVLVSDNCSTVDSTGDFAKALEGFSDSRVVRQSSNLGFDGNLKALSTLARGTYIWFIGAGDTLVDGSMADLIALLKEDRYSWGSVMGLFNYHRHEEYIEPLETNLFASSKYYSETQVFNHAISLNIFKTEILRNFSCRGHGLGRFRYRPDARGGEANLTPEIDECYWPHLEAVGQFALENSDSELIWFEYLRKTVLLNSNKNGNWDKGKAAMRIFAQWSDVVASSSVALPRSAWLRNLNAELRSWHLLRFTFMLRQDSNLRSADLLLLQQRVRAKLPVFLGATLIWILPRFSVSLLAWVRRRFWPKAPSYKWAR